jgi:cell division protein FtsB
MKFKKPSTVLLFAVLIGGFMLLLAPRIVHVEKLKIRSRDLNKEVMRLKKENLELESELKLLREDPVYLEKVARGKFNKAKEGEIIYKVVRE